MATGQYLLPTTYWGFKHNTTSRFGDGIKYLCGAWSHDWVKRWKVASIQSNFENGFKSLYRQFNSGDQLCAYVRTQSELTDQEELNLIQMGFSFLNRKRSRRPVAKQTSCQRRADGHNTQSGNHSRTDNSTPRCAQLMRAGYPEKSQRWWVLIH